MIENSRHQIRQFIADRCLGTFRDDEPLMSSGRVDSLGTIHLMMFLESHFGLDTADPDFEPAFLDSVDEIMLLLARRP